jgi:hypothetical protein
VVWSANLEREKSLTPNPNEYSLKNKGDYPPDDYYQTDNVNKIE